MAWYMTKTGTTGAPLEPDWTRYTCDQCGITFDRRHAQRETRSGRRFCSRDCAYAWRHDHRKTDMAIEPRRYRVNDETGCWEWLGAKVSSGYGSLGIEGKIHAAHVVSYIQHKGPIPEGLELDHTCRNRGCINPDHLEAVTRRENVIRGKVYKLKPELVRELRRRGNESSRVLGREFGLSKTTVTDVVKRRKWADIPD